MASKREQNEKWRLGIAAQNLVLAETFVALNLDRFGGS